MGMKLSWQWMVVIVTLSGLSVLAEYLGQSWTSGALAGAALGLVPKAGAVGLGPKSGPPSAVALVLAVLSLSGCAPAILVAGESLGQVCDAAGDEIEAAHARGELSAEQAEQDIACVRAGCNRIVEALEEQVDGEEAE